MYEDTNPLPQDFQIRAATMEDLGAVVQLLTACDLADSGEPQWSDMQRDISTISLSVDTQSLTGANRLYERAGMSVTDQYHTYEKRVHAESSASSTQDR